MVMKKRAQFFLLAAVIIVAVVISLGITANQATVNREPESFYDFSYEVSREVGRVIDYEIYSEFDDDADLDEFVDLLTEDIKDKDPDANFIIVYGDNVSGMEVRNEGVDDALVEGEVIEGKKKMTVNRVCYENSCQNIDLSVDEFGEEIGNWKIDATQLKGQETIEIDVNEQVVSFPISRHKQVFSIIKKDVGDESFVSVE